MLTANLTKTNDILFASVSEDDLEIMRDFWSFVKEHNDSMLVSKVCDIETGENRIEMAFDISPHYINALNDFVDRYLSPDEPYDATVVVANAVIMVLYTDMLCLDETLDADVLWSLRPAGIRDEW